MGDTLTVLTAKVPLTKRWTADGEIIPSANAKYFTYNKVYLANIHELSDLLVELETQQKSCIIRGEYIGDEQAEQIDPEYQKGKVRRTKDNFRDQSLHSIMIDVDGFESLFGYTLEEPEQYIEEYIISCLPKYFHNVSYHWQLSSSAGKLGSEDILKVHLWFWLKTPCTSHTLSEWVNVTDIECDAALFNSVQIHLTANPIFENESDDPVTQRSGFFQGESDEVNLVIDEELTITDVRPSRQQVRIENISNSAVALYLKRNDYVKSQRSDGGLNIHCPFSDGHSVPSTETSTVYFPPHTGGYAGGAFKCMHQSCSHRSHADFLNKLGLKQAHVFNGQDHTGIAKTFLNEKFTLGNTTSLIRNIGSWYHYRDTHYVERQDDAIRAELRHFLHGTKKINNKDEEVEFYPSMMQMSGVVDALSAHTLLEDATPPVWRTKYQDEEPTNFVSFTNGILNITTRTLLPHDPDLFTVQSLPYDYVAEGTPEEFLTFLEEIFDGDQESIDTLQEVFGYLLTPMTFIQKMFMLLGPKRSGKGTLARILTRLLGEMNVCGMNLNSLAGNFGLQPLLYKLLAIFPDVRVDSRSDIKAIIGYLLSISGEDDMIVDRKYKTPWSGKMDSRILIISNELPQLVDANDALSSRFIYLSTKKSFYGKEDIQLTQRLLRELPQIFLWALDGRDRLLKRGCFVQPESSKHLLEDNKRLSNPLYAFMDEMCELDPTHYVQKNVLYDTYHNWCSNNGYKFPKSLEVFSKELKSTESSISFERQTLPESGGKRVYVYRGIHLIPEDEFDTTDL